jgi:hypothetical protein
MGQAMTSFMRSYGDPASLQMPADVAVVTTSILRPSLVRAVQSVFAQKFPGRIQMLIGLDSLLGSMDLLDQACANRPSNVVVQVLYPGYSTSVRHGGVTKSNSGGALRCLLSLMANSHHIAYLDDDNWFHPDHLRILGEAIKLAPWAWSLRWFVHPDTARPICIDTWESVGPGRGVFNEHFGGFVDTNCLMLDKRHCEHVLLGWNRPLPGDDNGQSEDRVVFDMLRQQNSVGTQQATTFYVLNPADGNHPMRLHFMGEKYAEAAGQARPYMP